MAARWLPLSLVLVAGTAVAVLPHEGAPAGGEPVRVRTVNPALQPRLADTPAWKAFVAGEGAGWEARFDEVTGTPHRMWGRGLDLGPLPDANAAGRAVLAWVDAHADLLGLGAAVPALRSAARVADRDAWYVDVDTLIDGLPVWRGGLTFRIAHDRLVMVGADAYPHAPVVNRGLLTGAHAVDAFLDHGPVPWVAHHDSAALREVLLPEVRGKASVLRRVWEVTSSTVDPVGRWIGLVDSETGEVVTFWNDIRFVDGHLQVQHDDRLGRGDLLTSPLSAATVSGGSLKTVTDVDGAWTLPDAEAYTVQLTGPRVKIHDQQNSPLTPTIAVPDDTIDADALSGSQAAASTFVFVQQVEAMAKTFGPDVSWVNDAADANVNVDDTCNAYWDGSLNLFRAGNHCRNTGRLADVVFHEWGHGFHYYSLLAGSFDGSLSEGAADTMAFFMTDDHELSPGFYDDDRGPLRDALNTLRWPEDYNPDELYVHENGMLFSGAMWDTREALRASLGELEATQVTQRIYAGLLKGGPDLETAYDEAVFADDDDDDLSNGTPHQCALVTGFGNHGLGPIGGFGIGPTLAEPLHPVAGVDLAFHLVQPNPARDCFDVEPTAGTLTWSTDGGATWTDTPLAVAGADLTATVPSAHLPPGGIVQWYASVTSNTGATLSTPTGGRIRPHTAYIGDVLPILCHDFEQGDGGFSHRLVEGVDGEGADDWTWGEPQGMGGDPHAAASGTHVWGTDLGGGRFNGLYQSDKHTALYSPKLSTRHYLGAFLQYARWLQVEDGYYDHATIEADGEVVWHNWGTDLDRGSDHHLDDVWETHVVDLGGHGDDGSVRLTWGLQSDGGLDFGGWNVDDVCLLAPDTTDNRLGISDFTATRTDGVVTLAWTMPRHDPVQEVRVVRRRAGWPTGPDDGDVVYDSHAVTLDAPATVVDATPKDDLYYAVYASNGTDWLSWTREGFNAASVEPSGRVGPPGSPTADPGGCGCTGTPAPPAGALAALGLLLLRRRRR